MKNYNVKNYTVITEHDLAALEAKVKQLLPTQWEPWGALVINTPVINGVVAPLYTQVMVQYDFIGAPSK
jgi:hypothetical protein